MNEITWILGGLLTLLLGVFIIFLIKISSGLSVVQATINGMQTVLENFVNTNTSAHKDIWEEVNTSREDIARIKGRMNGKE